MGSSQLGSPRSLLRRALLTFALGCADFGVAHAQTVKDMVREHVREELEGEQEKPHGDAVKDDAKSPRQHDAKDGKPKAKKQREVAPEKPGEHRKPSSRRSSRQEKLKPMCREGEPGCFTWSSDDRGDEPEGPDLPVRVIHENLRMDLSVGGGYRGWYAQQYSSVDVDVGTYYTWRVGAKLKLFKFLSIKHAYYESNGVSAPRTKRAARAGEASRLVPHVAWLIGALGVPALKVWEPTLVYEARSFETRGRPRQPVCVVEQDSDRDVASCPRTSEPLVVLSGFETLIGGITYHHSRDPSPVLHTSRSKVPPIFFGAGFVSYRKPYQVTVDGQTLDDLLFDGHFRGGGLALGTSINQGVDGFYGDVSAQVGIGQVRLTDDLTLNEVLPDDWRIGYALGDLLLGYRWAMLKRAPTLILVPEVRIGGAFFYFFETELEEGEKVSTPTANYDLLWGFNTSLILPL